jgi:hypothetical protein
MLVCTGAAVNVDVMPDAIRRAAAVMAGVVPGVAVGAVVAPAAFDDVFAVDAALFPDGCAHQFSDDDTSLATPDEVRTLSGNSPAARLPVRR